MTTLARLPNTQETFDWLEANIGTDWFIDCENNDVVEIEFEQMEDARFAVDSLPKV